MTDRVGSNASSSGAALLARALDALTAHVSVLDHELRIVIVNEAWRAFAAGNGLEPHDAGPGVSYEDVVARAARGGDEDAARVLDLLHDLVAGTCDEIVHEYPCHSPSELRWFVLRGTSFTIDGARFFVLSHENVTPQRVARDQAERSAALFRAAVETAPDIVLITDAEGLVEFAGPLPHGLRSEQVVGRSILDVTPADLRPWVRDRWALAQGTDEVVQYEVDLPAGDGMPERAYALRLRRLRVGGARTRLLVFATDVTERRRAAAERDAREERLRELRRLEALGELAGGVAHDFNNLLTAIRYQVSFARDRGPSAKIDSELAGIDRAAEQATQLTQQLLAFARRQTLQREVLDPSEAVSEALPSLGHLLGEQVRIVTELAADARWVRVDRSLFRRMLAELASDAREAGARTLRIATSRGRGDLEGWILIITSDDGAIPADLGARLFEPFGSRTGRRGRGLGLATVFGMVSQSGGTIDVTTSETGGARFTVRLPWVDASPAEETSDVESDEPLPTDAAAILLVEDEQNLRYLAARALRLAGYEVLVASGASAALELSADPARRIDLLLSDVVMPDRSGPELATEIRRTRPRLPVLFVSGHAANVLAESELERLGAAFLGKPFTPHELNAKIVELLDRRASRE